jgi:hypothetical protein
LSKPSDRLFHLTLTAFAGVLTVISGVTVWTQHEPGRLRQWMAQWPEPAWLQRWDLIPQHPVANRRQQPLPSPPVDQNVQHNKSTPSQPESPAPSRPQSDAAQVKVIGRGVPSATIRHVQDLLQREAVPSLVAGIVSAHLREPVHLYLAQTAADYKSVLSSLGVSPEAAARFSRDTGGFTQDSTIVVPMYQNEDDADLINTLAHELTHVYLNQNVGELPSWIDEGLAVYAGMEAQKKLQDPVAYDGYVKRAADSVIDAAASGSLIPLTADESQVLAGGQPYDLELQDWIAVADLFWTQGAGKVHKYLAEVAGGQLPEHAFSAVFGMSENAFNQRLTQLLLQAATAADDGVNVALSVDGSYAGALQVLQHGSQTWRGIAAEPGTHRIAVLPDGTVTSDLRQVSKTQDSQPADRQTLYIDLDPASPLTYQGQKVDDCGFAVDVRHGVYAFVNSWITVANGKSVYLDTPVLFGVRITAVQDRSPNPLQWLWNSG